MTTAPPTAATPATERKRWVLKMAVAMVLGLVASLVLLVRDAQSGERHRLARLKALERRLNPMMLNVARAVPWGLARLQHRGRRSGRLYATPLLAEPVGGGFLIAMPYGAESDWVQNVLAAGEGVLRHGGNAYSLHNPWIASTSDAGREMPPLLRVLTRVLAIRHVLRIDATPLPETPVPTVG